jgi:hypothetical protein
MSEFFRDTIWQFIGVFVALAALGFTIYVYYVQRKRKSLSCRLSTETPLFVHEDGKFHTTYEGRPVHEVFLLIISVSNDGNVPIQAADFEKQLTFSFGTSARVLEVGLLSPASPPSLNPILRIAQSSVVVEPLLLNSKDSFTIKILCDQYTVRDFGVQARIVGVSEVKFSRSTPVIELFDMLEKQRRFDFLHKLGSIVTMLSIFVYAVAMFNSYPSPPPLIFRVVPVILVLVIPLLAWLHR